MGKFIPSEYQERIFDFIENGEGSAIVNAVAGCLSGDTIVPFNRASKGFRVPLRKAFLRFNGLDRGPHCNWDRGISTLVRSYNGDDIRLHPIQNIVESGVQKLFMLTLENGKSIKATWAHEFMTTGGWVSLSQLKVGKDEVMCDVLRPRSKGIRKPKRRDPMLRALKYHSYGQKDSKGGVRIELHRGIFEARLNGLMLESYIEILKTDARRASELLFVDMSKFEIHHIDGNHCNNDPNNLCAILRSEHRKIHGCYKYFNQDPEFSRVMSIAYVGQEMTYDIVCHDPYRNFVANGMIVHNSGKTTTIVQALKYVPIGSSVLLVAFNKNIVDELVSRVPDGCAVYTFNSIGSRAWYRYSRGYTLDTNKDQGVIDAIAEALEEKRPEWKLSNGVLGAVKQIVKFSKIYGVVPKALQDRGFWGAESDTDEVFEYIIDNHDIELDDAPKLNKQVTFLRKRIKLGELEPTVKRPSLFKAMSTQNQNDVDLKKLVFNVVRQSLCNAYGMKKSIDFTDQLIMPLIYKAEFPQYDFVFVDEAQDVSAIQREMVFRMLKRGGRIIATGDVRQAIYGWRGAGINSIEDIQKEFNCQWLPLSISYRCPKLVVEEAKQIVPEIEAWDGSGVGVVQTLARFYAKDVQAGDAFVCRYNAPIVQLTFNLLKWRKPVMMIGRDISKEIKRFIERFDVYSVEDLKAELDSWKQKEVEKATKKENFSKVARIYDKYETVMTFVDLSKSEWVSDVIDIIDQVYARTSDNPGKDLSSYVVLSSIHRAKGMEFDRVFFLDADQIPCKHAKLPWQKQQEQNLKYVGITRAKKELYYIKSKDIIV